MARIWTVEEKTEMRRLRGEGVGLPDIAARYGVNTNTVRKLLGRLEAASRAGTPVKKSPSRTAPLPPTVSTSMPYVEPHLLQRRPGSPIPTTIERLRAAHDRFDHKTADARRSSRPSWAD